MEQTILGLDLGSASIGWALISENKEQKSTSIIDMGCRIIPYDGNEGDDFKKGGGESKNAERTSHRGARRNLDRYQQRREKLRGFLILNEMLPDEALIKLPKVELWGLRAKAVEEQISLQELGRILMWLNQKRGYRSSRSEANMDKADTDYVAAVKGRHEEIKKEGVTIGQYFYNKLSQDPFFRIKENVFPRDAYIEEFDAIIATQKKFYPQLTDTLIGQLRDETIFHQRPLKSQKGLVAYCEFERKEIEKEGKKIFIGPRVAHRSNPLFQVSKIWESVNNITLKNRGREEIIITLEQRKELFNQLNEREKLTFKQFSNILQLNEKELYVDRKTFLKGLQGSNTKHIITKALGKDSPYLHLLELNFEFNDLPLEEGPLYSPKTGEEIKRREIDKRVTEQPLYRLWHTIYSINEIEECKAALMKNFGLDEESALSLASIDFTKLGYSNKSVKVLRRTIPYLMDGYGYSEAMEFGGYRHSDFLTKEENLERALLDKLEPIAKNSLRQPVVEKILNQLVNVVNQLIEKHGKPDKIRIELARELKQSKEERRDTELFINRRERENERFKKEIEEYGLPPTRNNLIKARLYEEISDDKKKLNAICFYCGQPISKSDAIRGDNIDVDHIIPRSLFFDDSQSNKVLVHRSCNATKSNQTAYDFMKGKSDTVFNNYIERVDKLHKEHIISKTKREKLLISREEIPQDFIDRQLRETQYISRKARELLFTICRSVHVTSGTVTATLRHLWGWDDVTENLQFDKYKAVGQTEIVTWESNHGKNKHQREAITNWTKRDDHRHHAIDALVIACTKQGFIQRLNTLNAEDTQREIDKLVESYKGSYDERVTRAEKSLIAQRPLTVKEVEDAVAKILISFKPGKRVASIGVRKTGGRGNKKIVQRDIIVPRGPLSEESVYGKIKVMEPEQPLKYLFENPDLIIKEYIQKLILERLEKFDGDARKAYANARKEPLYLDKEKVTPLKHATCFKEEYVIKYPVNSDFNKVDKVVDEGIKEILQTRLDKFDNNHRVAFRDVETEDGETIKWYEDEGLDIPILSVRCKTGLSAVVPLKKHEDGVVKGYVKPGNNHHVALYRDSEGKLSEYMVTFWHAVERKKFNIPIVIKETNELWDTIEERGVDQFPLHFLELLPPRGLTLAQSLQQNEMFLLGLTNEEAELLIEEKDYRELSNYLYRVQKLSAGDYSFRHHLETQVANNTKEARDSKRYYRVASFKAFTLVNPLKVRISTLGELIV